VVHSVCLHHLECSECHSSDEDNSSEANGSTGSEANGSANEAGSDHGSTGSAGNGSTIFQMDSASSDGGGDGRTTLTSLLSWEESQSFVETLLAPACRPPQILALQWQAGDMAVFDNLRLQHSVTPSICNGNDDAYASIPGEFKPLHLCICNVPRSILCCS
jgi:hypothetical protein